MKTKRLFSTLLTLAMVISLLSGFTVTVSAADDVCSTCNTDYVNGFCECENGFQPAQQVSATHHPELNSTHSGYYAIENAGQLYWFADYVNNQSGAATNAVLTDDITVNTNVLDGDGNPNNGTFKEWTPIGNDIVKFTGIFDGANHTVRGLYLDAYGTTSSTGKRYVSFIGYGNKATLKNLTVRDSFFAGYEWVGGLAGCFWSNGGLMENCVSYATVKGLQNVGGVAGGIQYASATNCHNHGLVMGSNMTGGFMGKTGYSSVFTNCSNTGTVKWISGSNGYFGGFVADASTGSGTTRAKFVNCFNSGNIIYEANNIFSNQIGGFASMTNGTYENCYASGSITVPYATEEYKVGGFGASAYSNLIITNCYYDNTKTTYGAVNNADRDGVTGKTTEQFASGEVAYLLNGSSSADDVVWKQNVAAGSTPGFEGSIVYYDGTKYYNPGTALTVTSSNVTIENLSEDAVLVVGSYKNKRMVDVKAIPVSSDCTMTISSTGLNVSDYHEIRAFLLKDLTDFTPLCEGDVYDKTGSFDGEWIIL